MLDLKQRKPDARAYGAGLEQWIIRTLAALTCAANGARTRRLWVARPDKVGYEDKIAAIGVRCGAGSVPRHPSMSRPDLSHFRRSLPCGVADIRYGVTSLVDLVCP